MPACKPTEAPAPQAAPATEAKPADVLIFPDELHVADESVNAFVERAMRVCGDGDYDAFRLLWSVRFEPLSREEFEEGWQAVQTIRVRALQKAIVQTDEDEPAAAAGETVYLLAADVELDPEHPAGRREPKRQVVLMLARERDEWRLARAPKVMREWIKGQVASGGAREDQKQPLSATEPATQK